MTGVDAPAAMRRSALSARHRQLGARFAAGAEWPATYGDMSAERSAIRESAGLLDVGPLDKISIAGDWPTLAAAVAGLERDRIAEGEIDGRRVQLWGLADDEALVFAPGLDARSSQALLSSLEARRLTGVDVSSLYAVLQLAGPRARTVLEELFPADISELALADRAIAFGPLAGVTVTLGRIDHRGLVSFHILCERDHTEYLWDSILHIGERHGVRAVGAAALAED